ncbi:Proprotein convertase P-domain [Nesidiocoris tenuis]|uniref:Proprotein convertase P-domain n=1 Tax=Nesidiocoris tenuis TaxID=355587 RepID=A0ABN7APT8_9HEMI|nr:Proprotein convertase P-domain [Nesidiocoris tenuis]
MVRSEMLWLWASLLVIAEVTSHYTHQWAAHIEGGPEAASRITQQHGFTLLAEIFPDTYHLIHSRVARRSVSPNRYHHRRLTSDKQVIWAKQLKVKRRVKRDLLTRRELGLSDDHVPLNDPKWPQMWYLNRGAGLDMSVEGAWKEGVTGKGIVVTILDDGLEKDHPDLQENYDPMASYDVNGHDDNPMPRYDMIDSNRHGTRCAGEVAAVANNSLCSLGIAYHASVGGVRMLDGDVTDAVEARSLSLNPQHIDIYSASWGPDDDGKTVDGPGELATRAFINGVNKGRGGKGSIFVWASGNGGRDHDNCNCDGYTNSIWTLSISSATEKGLVPWYSEACSSTLATTYSSGSTGEKQIVTTDLHHQCTINHTGTSASAPLAAGICALALEANTDLTWRDMQHIVVATAKPANLKGSNWVTNGVGRNVSHSFGYGLMDAAAMVRLARSWVTVPTQQKCEVSAPHTDKAIPAKSHVTLQLNVKECPGVRYLEHVQAKITLMTQRRGDIEIHLTSPAGTKTMLLAKRPHDVSRTGFRNWPFMSVHTWGENPVGKWSLEIHNEARFLGRATLQEWALILYGTDHAPLSVNQAYVPPSLAPNSTSAPLRPASPTPAPSGTPKKGKGSRNKNKGPNSPSTKAAKGKGKKLFDQFPPSTANPFPFSGQSPANNRKTPRPSVIQARRPTMPPVSASHPVGLTILLAPPQKPSDTSQNFPAIFQQYHKVQQLFPYSKINESPVRPSKKGLVQTEPQRESGKE